MKNKKILLNIFIGVLLIISSVIITKCVLKSEEKEVIKPETNSIIEKKPINENTEKPNVTNESNNKKDNIANNKSETITDNNKTNTNNSKTETNNKDNNINTKPQLENKQDDDNKNNNENNNEENANSIPQIEDKNEEEPTQEEPSKEEIEPEKVCSYDDPEVKTWILPNTTVYGRTGLPGGEAKYTKDACKVENAYVKMHWYGQGYTINYEADFILNESVTKDAVSCYLYIHLDDSLNNQTEDLYLSGYVSSGNNANFVKDPKIEHVSKLDGSIGYSPLDERCLLDYINFSWKAIPPVEKTNN